MITHVTLSDLIILIFFFFFNGLTALTHESSTFRISFERKNNESITIARVNCDYSRLYIARFEIELESSRIKVVCVRDMKEFSLIVVIETEPEIF